MHRGVGGCEGTGGGGGQAQWANAPTPLGTVGDGVFALGVLRYGEMYVRGGCESSLTSSARAEGASSVRALGTSPYDLAVNVFGVVGCHVSCSASPVRYFGGHFFFIEGGGWVMGISAWVSRCSLSQVE